MTKDSFVLWEMFPAVLETSERMPLLHIHTLSVSGPAAVSSSPFSVEECAEEECGHTALGGLWILPQKK